MARTRTHATRRDEGTKQRDIADQPTPFIGLALAPFFAVLLTWVTHYAITGWTLGDRHVGGSQAALGGAVIIITLGAVYLSYNAYKFAHDRHEPLRVALTLSTYVIVQWLALLVWVGPNRWWDTFFVLCAEIVVGMWALPRLHVLRRDPREDTGGEDDLAKQFDLKGFKFGTPNVAVGADGQPERMVFDVRHRLGATRDTLTTALPNLESIVGAPGGLSRAVKPDDGKSNHTILTIMLKDPLTQRVPYNGPSHPGGSITDPAYVGRYDDGQDVWVWVAGGFIADGGRDSKGNPTGEKIPPNGYAFMGMTRAGKTVTENRLLLECAITRRDAVILYVNKAKGAQDVGPILDGVEVAVVADDTNEHRKALDKVRDIISYRQKELARFGIQAWGKACFYNPPGLPSGERMKPMPALLVHVGEADAVLEMAGDEAVYIASKGLSVGVIAGWSLQRWAATSMPTDLRFNLGTRFCFGVGDDYSAAFALSDPTIAAGAHPENWRNTKPGRFFLEGPGIDDTRWPVSAKGVGDEDDDTLFANMRADAALYGPLMARLDEGSVLATRGWWRVQQDATNRLRAERDAATAVPNATPTADPNMTVSDRPTTEPNTMPNTTAFPDAAKLASEFVASPPTDDQDPALMELVQDIAEIHDIDGVPIRGGVIPADPDDPEFLELGAIDPHQKIPPVGPGDEVDLTETDKRDALSAEEAQEAFDDALRQMAKLPEFRDPDDPSGRSVIFRVHQFVERYPFRTRSWFSPMLNAAAVRHRPIPPGLTLEQLPDRRGEGWFRLTDDRPDEDVDQ